MKLAKFSAKLVANFRGSLEGDSRAFFAWENRQKHFPPKLHREFHRQTSLRGSGLWRALETVLSPCNFATIHLTARILSFHLPATSQPMKWRTRKCVMRNLRMVLYRKHVLLHLPLWIVTILSLRLCSVRIWGELGSLGDWSLLPVARFPLACARLRHGSLASLQNEMEDPFAMPQKDFATLERVS